MKALLIQTLFLNMLFIASCQSSEKNQIIIKPLSPYTASPANFNTNERKNTSFIVKYYFIEGASKATDKLSQQVNSFIIKRIQHDSDFANYGGYHLLFYKKTKVLNENFKEVIDGMISNNSLDSHQNELLFEYTWSGKDFIECNYYRNGKIIKTTHFKNSSVFKSDPSTFVNDSSKVTIKDISP